MTTAGSGDDMRVAAVQTVSGTDVDANLAAVEPLIVAAKEQGATLVLLPEYFGIFCARETEKVEAHEAEGNGPHNDVMCGPFRSRYPATGSHRGRPCTVGF